MQSWLSLWHFHFGSLDQAQQWADAAWATVLKYDNSGPFKLKAVHIYRSGCVALARRDLPKAM